MDERSRVFYSRMFSDALLNLHAVRLGMFTTYISEMPSPFYYVLWREAVPRLASRIYKKLQEERDGYT
jgi:hypothetical protein